MNSFKFVSTFLLLVLSANLHAQDLGRSDWNIVLTSGIGYGKIDNENQTDYNLNSNDAEAPDHIQIQ